MAEEKKYGRFQYPDSSRRIARVLRRQATFPERLLWSRLRRRQLGFRFLRQKPLGHYVVDFYCPPYGLSIELDGRSHDGTSEVDHKRQQNLEQMGVRFLRFTNDEVLRDVDRVITIIRAWIEKQELHPPNSKAPKPPPP